MKHWLIGVLGTSPAVITEMAWWLSHQGGISLERVHLWTTELPGVNQCRGRKQLIDDGSWNRLNEALLTQGKPPHCPPEEIRFHAFKLSDERPIYDVRTEDDNTAMTQQICRHIRAIHDKHDDIVLHACISGGRKSMSAMMQTAMQLFGRESDRVYHVLVHKDIEDSHLLKEFEFPKEIIEKDLELRDLRKDAFLRKVEEDIPLDRQITVARQAVPFLRPLVPLVAKDLVYENIIRELNLKVTEIARQEAPLKKDMIGVSPAAEQMREFVRQVASKNAKVLLLGESGTGKEVMAEMIHANSNRHDKPFVVVNCGALPDTLIESELFGHVQGAFTDAKNDRLGAFRKADKGTLFMDEIGDLPLKVQVKLLRILEDGKVQPLGSNKTIKVDVQVIAATNKDLSQMVREGTFREDLYYRLNIAPFHLRPLRERREDILPLIKFFLKKQVDEGKVCKSCSLSKDVEKMLHNYPWPGNVRELRTVIERISIFHGEEKVLEPKHFQIKETNSQAMSEAIGEVEFLQMDYARKMADLLRQTAKLTSFGKDKINLTATVNHLSGQRWDTATAKNKLKQWLDNIPAGQQYFQGLENGDAARQLYDMARKKSENQKRKGAKNK